MPFICFMQVIHSLKAKIPDHTVQDSCFYAMYNLHKATSPLLIFNRLCLHPAEFIHPAPAPVSLFRGLSVCWQCLPEPFLCIWFPCSALLRPMLPRTDLPE